MPIQHQLLVLIFKMRKKFVEKKIEFKRGIMWDILKGKMVATLTDEINKKGYSKLSKDGNLMWETMAKTIRQVAKETLGESIGEIKVYKESC